MRLDKYLKVSRIIKRRNVANEACDNGRVTLNGKTAKPSADVSIGDVIGIRFGERCSSYRVISLTEPIHKEDAIGIYEIINSKTDNVTEG